MLPRSKNRYKCNCFIIVITFTLFFGAGSLTHAENVVTKFYQDHISVVDGNRCQMHPTCSAYASKAIEKHGAVLGWIMACDRLVRCGRDEQKVSPTVKTKNSQSIYDPVKANDFWWFEKKE